MSGWSSLHSVFKTLKFEISLKMSQEIEIACNSTIEIPLKILVCFKILGETRTLVVNRSLVGGGCLGMFILYTLVSELTIYPSYT